MSEETYELLRLERRDDLLWVTLDNAEKSNALSPKLLAELTDCYQQDWRAEGVRALLLAGAGKNFSAGADLDHLRSLQTAGAEQNLEDSQKLRALFESVLRQEALTIALVQGYCVAGGCGLATAHDFVVAAEDAQFLYSEVKIGFVAALVATYLPLRVRGSDLREMLLFPQFLDARRALEVGLANRVVPPPELAAQGEALAAAILSNASSESIARTKRLLLAAFGRPLDEALHEAVQANAASRTTEDCKHGIAKILETKKPPRWR